MPSLVELLNPKEVGIFVGLFDEVDCFEDNDAGLDVGLDPEVVEANALLIDDPVEVGEVETVALDDEIVADGILYPADA